MRGGPGTPRRPRAPRSRLEVLLSLYTELDTWGRNGDLADHFGLTTSNPSMEDGLWKVKFVKSGRILGQSRLTLQTDSTC